MFSFTQKQEIITIQNISFGGQPGQYPTVLFGGLFFKGQPQYQIAEKNLKALYQTSKKTGVPVIPDFFIKKEKYLKEILDFISKTVPNNHPFSIDIIDPQLKIAALLELELRNLLDRVIYNSIHIGTTDEEIETLNHATPAMAILVAFNPKDTSPDGKIEVLENGAHLRDNGLFAIAHQCGIKKTLVDTAALAPGQNSGAAIASLPVIKEEYGLPVGCALHNVVEKSIWLTNFSKIRKLVDIASNINIPLFGGDFAIYGPIEHASKIIPLIAWQDILISEYSENYFGIKPSDTHPRKILQD